MEEDEYKINLEAQVAVVKTKKLFDGMNIFIVRKKFPVEIKNAVLAAFALGIVNKDTGLKIGMSKNDFDKHLFVNEDKFMKAHLEAIAALPELMQKAKRTEIYNDKRAVAGSHIKQLHRFISAFSDDVGDYAVLLTVKEHEDKTLNLDTKYPVRLYHHRVERQLTPASSASAIIELNAKSTSSSANIYTIGELLVDVKDSKGNFYLQEEEDRQKSIFRPFDSIAAKKESCTMQQRLAEMEAKFEKLLRNMPGEQARIQKRKKLMEGIAQAEDKEKAFANALASLKSLTIGRSR
jgi:hypothetical protein